MFKSSLLFICLVFTTLVNAQIKPENEFQLGMQKYNQKNYKQAIPFFNALIDKSEDQYKVLYFRGLSKFALSDFLGAEIDLRKATYYKPFYPEAFHNLALVQINSGKLLSGIQSLNKSLEQDSLNAEAYFHRAISYFQINQFDASIDDINKCLGLNALQLKAIRLRVECYKNQERYDDAMDDILVLIEKKADLEKDYLIRAELFQSKEDYKSALKDAQYISTYINADNLEAKYIMAFNYHKLDKSSKAMHLIEEILSENPYHTQALYLKGIELWKQDRLSEALNELSLLSEQMPKNVLIINELAKINIQKKQYTKALKLLKRSSNIFEEFPETYKIKSEVYLRQNKLKLAQKEDELYVFYNSPERNYPQEKQYSWKQKYLSLKPVDKEDADKNTQLKNELRLSQHVQLNVTNFVVALDPEVQFKSKLLKSVDQIELYPFRLNLGTQSEHIDELDLELSLNTIDSLILENNKTNNLVLIKALLYYQNFKLDKAEETLTQLLHLAPNHALGNSLMAQIYWVKWEVEKNKETPGFLLNTDKLEDTKEAKRLNLLIHKYFNKAIKAQENADFVYYNYALFMAQQQKVEAAIELLEKAFLINNNEKEIAYNLALINYKLDRFDEACKYLSIAGELGKQEAYELITVICR